MHCTFTVQRDKAKESVSGYELRIKKYIEELKVASSKASESEAAMGKLRVEMSESRKTVNEVLHSSLLPLPLISRGSKLIRKHRMRFLRAQTYEVRVKELREQLAAEQRELAERTRKFELEVSYSYALFLHSVYSRFYVRNT